MNPVFIVAEYNPFHNGHAYHIERVRRELAPDAVICVMSGHFTQRGTPAIVDKWTRARMALRGGADLVLELHPAYACAGAEGFARGALLTLSALGAEGRLSFGAECDDLNLLCDIAAVLADEPEAFKARLATELKRGVSFAEARAHAAAVVCAETRGGAAAHSPSRETETVARVMHASNNILALEYLKTIRLCGLPFGPHVVLRAGAGHLDAALSNADGGISGASAIREHIRTRMPVGNGSKPFRLDGNDRPPEGGIGAIPYGALPDHSAALLASEFELGRGPVFADGFYAAILTLLRRATKASLRTYPGVREGLENRVAEAARRATRYDGLVGAVAARRYPKSAITRLLCHVLLGMDSRTLAGLGMTPGGGPPASPPPYIRVLGFTERGRRALAALSPAVPAVTNYKALSRLCKQDARVSAFVELDTRATDIYVSAFPNPAHRAGGQDYTRGPVVLETRD